jgi:pimeloyl-ACP methyl ester carboxylesterase
MARVSARAILFSLRQVRLYFSDESLRTRIKERLIQTIQPDTRVVVAHSLGTVVAYEALWSHPDAPVAALVTLGSPLGVPSIVLERLRPPAGHVGRGTLGWPKALRSWTNIADEGDVVALIKRLHTAFGERIDDVTVNNGARAHSAEAYLSTAATGRAVWPYVSGVATTGHATVEPDSADTP